MGAPALAIRQGVPEPPDHTARLRCGSFAFRRLRRIQNWRSSSSLYRLHCGLIPIETGRTGALRAGISPTGFLAPCAATNSAYPGTCCCMGQARVSKVAEREVDGLTRLAERPFHVI